MTHPHPRIPQTANGITLIWLEHFRSQAYSDLQRLMHQGWQTAADKRKDADPLMRHINATRADSAPRPLLPCCIVVMCLRQSALKAKQKANPLLRIFCFQLCLITRTRTHTHAHSRQDHAHRARDGNLPEGDKQS